MTHHRRRAGAPGRSTFPLWGGERERPPVTPGRNALEPLSHKGGTSGNDLGNDPGEKPPERPPERPPAYLPALLKHLDATRPGPGVHHVEVHHAHDCGFWDGVPCDCRPIIESGARVERRYGGTP